MLIEFGASWFSSKCVEAQLYLRVKGVELYIKLNASYI